jgi:small conductance mechanosensitive channel
MDYVSRFGVRLIGAIALWIVGRWLIRLAGGLSRSAMARRHMDETAINYVASTVTGLLNIILIISILGVFGVPTTTFAALIAAIGFAIGLAWSGLLGNFAAGVFLMILKPFKVGDVIQAGGVLGTVTEIGPFVCKMDTLDNVHTMVGNSRIFADNIANFSANPYRRVDLFMQLDHGADVAEAVSTLKSRLATIPNVLTDPPPVVEILEFTLNGPRLAVRPFCSNEHYWQVYFDTNKVVREFGTERHYAAPSQHVVVREEQMAAEKEKPEAAAI